MGLLLLLFPFAEIYTFFKLIDAYSFFDVLLFVIFSSAVGATIIRLVGPSTLTLLQTDLAQGRLPANQILQRSLIVIGGFLLFIPGIISSVIGALCILPGTRHLIGLYIKHLVKRGLFKGRVFMSGFGNAGGFGGGFSGGFSRTGGFSQRTHTHSRPDWEEPRVERDAEVVDIKPLEISHKNIPPGGNDSNGSEN